MKQGELRIDEGGGCEFSEDEPALLFSSEPQAVRVHAVDEAGDRLNGSLGFPYETTPANSITVEPDPEDSYRHIISARMPGLVELRPLAPHSGPPRVIDFYVSGAPDGLIFYRSRFGDDDQWTEIEQGSSRVFRSTPKLGDRAACRNSAWSSVIVDTPEICSVEHWAGKDGHRISGLAPGECVLQVTQAGVTDTFMVPVVASGDAS